MLILEKQIVRIQGKSYNLKNDQIIFLNLCYWSLVNLLRCVNFGCAVNWFRYICVCVYQ